MLGEGAPFAYAPAGIGADEYGDAEVILDFKEFGYEVPRGTGLVVPLAEIEERVDDTHLGAGLFDGPGKVLEEGHGIRRINVSEVDFGVEEITGLCGAAPLGEAAVGAADIDVQNFAGLRDGLGDAEGRIRGCGGVFAEHAGKFAFAPEVKIEFVGHWEGIRESDNLLGIGDFEGKHVFRSFKFCNSPEGARASGSLEFGVAFQPAERNQPSKLS